MILRRVLAPPAALALARSDRPVLVSRWLGEGGFDLLPRLKWTVRRCPELGGRLRGGAGTWYEHLASGYADVCALAGPEEVAAPRGHRTKQVQATDRERAAEQLA